MGAKVIIYIITSTGLPDLGLLLDRDEYYNSDTEDSGVMEIIVGKNRNGSIGTCRVDFNPSIGEFSLFE